MQVYLALRQYKLEERSGSKSNADFKIPLSDLYRNQGRERDVESVQGGNHKLGLTQDQC